MRFSEALGRKVVSLASAETAGLIDEFIVDPSTHRIVALGLSKSKQGDTLTWDRIAAFGIDAVTIADEGALSGRDPSIAHLGGKDRAIVSKRVLLTIGDEIGHVSDVEFEADSGLLTTILLDGRAIEASSLIGIGSYAVVVDDDTASASSTG